MKTIWKAYTQELRFKSILKWNRNLGIFFSPWKYMAVKNTVITVQFSAITSICAKVPVVLTTIDCSSTISADANTVKNTDNILMLSWK